MGKPAARLTDMHTCPMVTPGLPPIPHVGGPIVGPGCPTVLIGGMPAAVMGDMCTCVGPPDTIILGSAGVLIGGKPAARMGDQCAHGGMITVGNPTVLIGEVGFAEPLTPDIPASTFAHTNFLEKIKDAVNEKFDLSDEDKTTPEYIAKHVNPLGGGSNCGKIIDAVIERLKDPDSAAIAFPGLNGKWDEIESRHNTKFAQVNDFNMIFNEVSNDGDGATALIGISGTGSKANAHVIVITNKNGKVVIIEGQGGGRVIDSPATAQSIYRPQFYDPENKGFVLTMAKVKLN
jgi:uncharacterized Zn-binding protein involved in type VI secretion